MRKSIIKVFFTVLILFSSSHIFSQEIEFTGAPSKNKKIALVPFDPYIYYNDATSIIAKRDNENHDEIMMYLRSQLNMQLYNAMMDSCIVINLLSEKTREANDEIYEIYSTLSYEMGLAMQNRPENYEDLPKEGFFNKLKNKKEEERKLKEMEEAKTRIEKGELVDGKMSYEDKYVHIKIVKPNLLQSVADKLNVEYFLFINQFEIKGDYRDPYISGNPNAMRTLKVHFSLYDFKSNLIHGGFGENKIPFHLDDKREIVNKYYPEVIRQIILNIDF
jgi:hypothetical protein